MPSYCSSANLDRDECGSSLCGEHYRCSCHTATQQWTVTIYDCWCRSERDCNLLTQSGCEQGEKCAPVAESYAPLLNYLACVPDGTAGQGQVCAQGKPGPETGYDNCRAGLVCIEGICEAICAVNEGRCALLGESTCVHIPHVSDEDFGICRRATVAP